MIRPKIGLDWDDVTAPFNLCGLVVQLVRMPACHAGGRRFEPVPGRQYADVAQPAEQLICNQQVIGSSPIIGFSFLQNISGL